MKSFFKNLVCKESVAIVVVATILLGCGLYFEINMLSVFGCVSYLVALWAGMINDTAKEIKKNRWL